MRLTLKLGPVSFMRLKRQHQAKCRDFFAGLVSESPGFLNERGTWKGTRRRGGLLLDDFDDDVINHLQGSFITYRIAVGLQRGKKVFTLKTLVARDDEVNEINVQTLAKSGGFSLHAGVSTKSHQRDKVERLCCYIARPDEERRAKKNWAMRLKRVFNIDITVCRHCQGPARIIACIEDRQVINQILSHINKQGDLLVPVTSSTDIRGPPNNTILQYFKISGESVGIRKQKTDHNIRISGSNKAK